MTIENNTWVDWGNDWFASVQGQTPGVQEQHLTLSNNTLEGDGSLFEVVGTNPSRDHGSLTRTPTGPSRETISPPATTASHTAAAHSVAGQLYFISDLR